MQLFITGATGFIGGALARTLINQGHTIHALARPASDRSALSNLPIQWHIGSLTEPDSLSGLFTHSDGIIHAAGLLGQHGRTTDDYYQANVLACHHLFTTIQNDTAHRPTPPRILHISSAGVMGPLPPGPNPPIPPETAPMAPSNLYENSKAESERVATTFAAQGLPITIARPEFLYGPGDKHVLGLFRMIKRRLFFYIGSGHNLCHPTYIDDAVTGLISCWQHGQPGQAYNICGPRPLPWREFVPTVAHALNTPPPQLQLPRHLVQLGAQSLEFAHRWLGTPVPLSQDGVAFFSQNRGSSYQRAHDEFGYTPQTDLQAGIKKTVTWYQKQGWL
ncbi:MAG TPA: NAD-dependent epimerase/dehydratase family protein [Anaerolineae bacterium]|nr:NAD-dependent epimerase/dehydratase family protein [Anaerolineae bacterium]